MKGADRFLLILLAASLIANIYLAGRAGSAHGPGPQAPPPFPPVSARVPDLDGLAPGGAAATVRFSESPEGTLVYVFSSGCGWCERNVPNVRAALEAPAPRPRFVAVSLDKTDAQAHLHERELSFDAVLQSPSRATVEAFRLGGTPYTYLVSPRNEIVGVWPGAWQGEALTAIGTRLRVALPGLAPDTAPEQRASCKDEQGRTYSPGFVVGQRRCGADGNWVALTS